MNRLHRLTVAISLVTFAVAGAAFGPPSHAASVTAPRAAGGGITVYDVATQLGVSVAAVYEGQDFAYGAQFTGTLKDPAKLASLGLDGFHVGARVVAAWIGPSVLYVEADEMEPQQKAHVRLHIGDDGQLAKM